MRDQYTPLSHLKYRPDIDGLRAIAVLSVVAFHAFPGWPMVAGGFMGVDVFFVISGFLISKIIFENLEKGSFSFLDFYVHRIKRIFPALLLVLIFSLSAGWFTLLADEYQQLGKHIAGGAGFISNFVLWSEAGYFDNSGETKPLLHLWSLGIEEQFYIVWPFLLWLAWKRRFNLFAITIFIAAASFFFNLKEVAQNTIATFYSPKTRFWELLAGSLLAWMQIYKKDACSAVKSKIDGWFDATIIHPQAPEENRQIMANILSVVGVSILACGFWKIDKDFDFPGVWAVIPVLATLFLISAGSQAWINRVVLSNQLFIWFGLISFPLYLWHWPLLSFARILSVEPPTKGIRISILVASIIFSWLTYRFIERPVRFGKAGKVKAFILMLSMIACGLFGYVVYANAGYAIRGNLERVDIVRDDQIDPYNGNFKNYHGDDINQSKKPLILIIGDSYIKNWTPPLVAKIDTNRFDVVSISYMGCDVKIGSDAISAWATEKVYKNQCKALQYFMNNESVKKRLSAVMLASHRPFEYTANPFRFDLIRWLRQKNPALELFIFGNYFQLDSKKYPSCQKLMARTHRDSRVCLEYSDYPPSEFEIKNLPFYPKDFNFSYIDIVKLHCNYNKIGCSTQHKGVPFISDWNHLNSVFLDSLLQDLQSNKNPSLSELGFLKYLRN